MSDPHDLVVCPSCAQLGPLGRWHACDFGRFVQLHQDAPGGAVRAVEVPRAVATPPAASPSTVEAHR